MYCTTLIKTFTANQLPEHVKPAALKLKVLDIISDTLEKIADKDEKTFDLIFRAFEETTFYDCSWGLSYTREKSLVGYRRFEGSVKTVPYRSVDRLAQLWVNDITNELLYYNYNYNNHSIKPDRYLGAVIDIKDLQKAVRLIGLDIVEVDIGYSTVEYYLSR